MKTVKVKKPYNLHIEAALKFGVVGVPAAPDGLYLCRIRKEINDIVDVKPVRKGEFSCTVHMGKHKFRRKRDLESHVVYDVFD